MANPVLENVNIKSIQTLATPATLREQVPETPAAVRTVQRGRETIERILDGDDPRFLAIVGPCSIHNLDGAAEYARRLRALADEVSDAVVVVMRVYFEKPRSVLGWKGLINDPYLNDTFRIGASSRDIKAAAALKLNEYTEKTSNALAPQQKLRLLKQ